MNATPTPITLDESKRLTELESVIKRGQESFIEVGEALLAIRDEKLYRSDYKDFDSYCKGQWGWGQKRASQIIIAANTVKLLPDSTIVESEGAARELSKVTKSERPAVLEKAAATGRVTAKSIKAAAEKTVPRAEEPAPASTAPLNDEAKQFRLSLRIQETKDFVAEKLTGLTNLEMMKFADSLKKFARQIEETVAKNEQDLAA